MQPGSKICLQIRNTAKTKQDNQQPHLAESPPKRAPSRGERRQKRMAGKMQQKRARHAALTPPRLSTVRGKPAYATGAFLALAPALVRRRPRRTSRRAKRTSPQPCPRRRRAECSVATAGLECSSFASKCVASMACWWGRGPFENTRRVPVRRHCNHDRFGRTCTTAASPSQP